VGIAAEFNRWNDRARFCGVGDMTAVTLTSEGRRRLQFSPGILGHQHRHFEQTDVALARDMLLLTASDGLRRSWEHSAFPGLCHLHPQLVTLLLGNVAGRSNDDKSLFAVRIAPTDNQEEQGL